MKNPQELKRLVLSIRQSKTAAEERKVIEQEKAQIRSEMSNKKLKQDRKMLNVSKLILIDMLGHDSSFAYFECIRLICENDYKSKKIGYLGISSLCTKSPDILIMCTSQLTRDLGSDNKDIISLALCTAANIADTTILVCLQPHIVGLFTHKDNVIKYRAIAAAIALIRICPETIQDVLSNINEVLMESSSTVFRSITVLFVDILKISNQHKRQISLFVQLVCSNFCRIIQQRSSDGVADPIGVVQYLRLLIFFADELSETCIGQLVDTSKVLGAGTKSSIKYEMAHLFLKTKNTFLNQYGNNILTSFVHSVNSNLRYCGLKLSNVIADWDKNKLKIVVNLEQCLSDANVEIRNLALSLSSKLINEENVQTMLKSYLNCLMSVNNSLHNHIVEKIADALNFPNIDPVWYLDTVIRACILAPYIPDTMIYGCINLIRTTESIQEFATKKLFYAINSGFRQNALPCLSFWSIGEHPNYIDELELKNFIEKMVDEPLNNTHIMYLVTMSLKVGLKVRNIKNSCIFVLSHFSFSEDTEVSQRASEYLIILSEFADSKFRNLLNESGSNTRVLE